MKTGQEIRQEVVAQLTNVYTNTPDGGEASPVWDMPSGSGMTGEEFAQAYVELSAMFLGYAQEVENEHGPSFLDYLQRQALRADDDPDED